jgi:hypothetical protein
VQVAIVQIIHVTFVLNAKVAAILTVGVTVLSMCLMRHSFSSFLVEFGTKSQNQFKFISAVRMAQTKLHQ